MKYVAILLLPLCMHAQVMWQIKKDTVVKWYYQDGDEFNSRFLNTDTWRSGMPWGSFVMAQDLYFDKDNVSMKNGTAVFESKKEKKKYPIQDWEVDKKYLEKSGKKIENNQYEVDYTSGMISSLKKYKYGMFELRFKSTDNRGIWPAFWLYGGEPNEEIDFFELKGERRNQVHVDVHCPNGCENYHGGFLNLQVNWGGWVNAKNNLADGWNIVTGEWQPGYVKWYLNGEPIAYFKGDFKTSQTLFINSSVARTGGGFSPGPDETTKWPNTFEVDYVRVWSKEDTVLSKPKNDYQVFEDSPETLKNSDLYSTGLKKKLQYVYNKKALQNEEGSITLLPVGKSKYSLSVQGPQLGAVKVDIFDRQHKKQMGITLNNVKYQVLDLKDLPTDLYRVEITVNGHLLTHDIPILDPATMPSYKQN